MYAKRIRGQMSESMLTAVFIILSGGLQDSYTYLCRGKVFANAQTGNIVLLSAYLFDGEWSHCTRYLVPVLAFMLGIFVAECVHRHYKYMERVHWRQLIILSEIVLLFAVGFLPQTINTFANAVVSFVCAMQVQTFRKVHRQHAQRHRGALRIFPHARYRDPAQGADVFRRDRPVRARRRAWRAADKRFCRPRDLVFLRSADNKLFYDVY